MNVAAWLFLGLSVASFHIWLIVRETRSRGAKR